MRYNVNENSKNEILHPTKLVHFHNVTEYIRVSSVNFFKLRPNL